MFRQSVAYLLSAALVAFASRAAAQPPTQPPSPPQTRPQTQPQTPQPPAAPQPPTALPPAVQVPEPVGTTGIMPPPPPTCVAPDMSTPVSLLDRAHRILNDAAKDPMGKVSLDRGSLDELRAIVEQVRASIEPIKQQ